MLTIGVEALDDRTGGLRSGGFYVVLGPGSAGKSVLGLHFLTSGLQRREPALLITRDDAATIDSRAMFIGYSPGRLTEHPQLRVVRLPSVLPSRHGASPADSLLHWLNEQTGGMAPRRIVIEDPGVLSSYSTVPHALLNDLIRFFERSGGTTLALIRSDAERRVDADGDAPFFDRADGVFRLSIANRGQRTFAFVRAPAGTFRTEPFVYALRMGAGFAEELPLVTPEIDPQDRRRVVVLDEIGALPAEALASLRELYDLQPLASAAGAMQTLSAARYGALVIGVDPYDDARAFDLVFALRKGGNAAPIVLVAPSRGLRSTTRSRGLRVGGDDFFVTDLPVAEIVERIQMAWLRGSHRRTGLSQIGQIVQPVNSDGQARPMDRKEFLRAMQILIDEDPPLFFCYVEFGVPAGTEEQVWPALRTRVRLGDGDIMGLLDDGRFGCVLDRITPEQTTNVLDRIRAAHTSLHALNGLVVIPSPIRVDEVRARLFARSGMLAASGTDG